jgi:ribosomal-protein-alanine N-acetyltransferase
MQRQKAQGLENDWTVFPAGDFRLNRMRSEDLDEVMKVERACFGNPWTRWYFSQELQRNPLSHLFVLRIHNNGKESIVGFLVCWILNAELHINNIAIHPDFQGKGLGKSLMEFAMDFGKKNNCHCAALEVRVSNQRAIELYKRLGFLTIGQVQRYYDDGENAWILRKQLR